MASILDPEPTNAGVRAGRQAALIEERVARMERKASTAYQPVGTAAAFSNGWRSYGGGGNDYTPIYFYRDDGGRVYIDGLADKNGGGFVGYEVIFTLPEGYRPDRNLIFTVESAGGSLFGNCQIRVNKTGVVQIGDRGGPTNPVVWVSFAGINFRVG